MHRPFGMFALAALLGSAPLFTLACSAETTDETEVTEDDLTAAEISSAGCTKAGIQTAKTAWSKAYQLSRSLSTTTTNDPAKLDAVAEQIDKAIIGCSAYAKYAYDASYSSAYTKQVRASGGTLAYAVRVAKAGDECTDPVTLADAAYATTAANAAFKKVVRSDAWAAPLREKLAGHFVRSELDGSSTSKPEGLDIEAQFGDLASVTFRAPRPGVLPVLERKIFKNGTYEDLTTDANADVVVAKGTWKATGDTITFTPAKGAASSSTLVRTVSKTGAPVFTLKSGGSEIFNYDPDLCSA